MNPSLSPSKIMSTSFTTIFVFILIPTVISSTKTISYSDHCNSFTPEAIPTTLTYYRFPFLEPLTSHYTGGQKILDPDSLSQRSIRFTPKNKIFKTNTFNTYKIQTDLTFFPYYMYHSPSNHSRVHRPLVFSLDGFVSISTNKLCVVGSAHWFSKKGKPLKLDAVLKLNLARLVNINTSLVSGILESLASPLDSGFFEPIQMMGFPQVAKFKYKYSLASNEECNGPKRDFSQEHSVASMQSLDLCSIFSYQRKIYQLEHQASGYAFLSLYGIQCSLEEKKLRFLVEFEDKSSNLWYQSFNPNVTLIGDGTWNGTKNELCIVACHILNQSDPLGSAHVGDCSVRLTVWFREIRSIENTHSTEGQIWSTKKAGDEGYFETINFQSFDHSWENYGSKYEFTKLEKVRQICPTRNFAKGEGVEYPSGYNGDMTLDMSVKNGNVDSTGSAVPIFVGNRFYNSYEALDSNVSPLESATPSMNISYEIRLRVFVNSTSESERGIPLFLPTDNGGVQISAEGFYDSETGRLCMVGCRNLPSSGGNSRNKSFDCEILVRFQFSPTNRNNGSHSIRGDIQSLREKTDVLYFDPLSVVSLTYTKTEAMKSIWRMDLEIIMGLISGTLSCFFIVMQLFHVKKNPEMIPLISMFMMVILTLGYMIPLVLNFEAMSSNTRYVQYIPLGGSSGLLEVSKVIIRILTMVALILQFRLLQLIWSTKVGNDNNGNRKNHWNHEIRTFIVCLPIYIIGGVIMLLANWQNNDYISSRQRSIWGDLRSYAGLTLDGFLFPQIILNIFQISKGNALSRLFYIGNTFVRLLSHAYDLYRGQNNISQQFDRIYLYANPGADFYSPSWDVFIVCGGVVFAVIVLLQHRFGGRFMLPKRFQEAVEYEMVPVVINE